MLFKQKIKKLIRKLFLTNNIFIGRTSNESDIVSLLKLLKPINTNHDLVRFGGDSDGGYLIPNDLIGINACFSPGVSQIANFECDLASRGIKCFLADFSVNSPPVKNSLFDFEKKFLGINNDEVFMTLENWIKRKVSKDDELLLQMDIEGSEYQVIFDTSEDILLKFRIIVIEFHYLDSIFDKYGFELIKLCFTKLLKHFEIVHIHPNNCCGIVSYKDIHIPPVMEFTFLRKDRIISRSDYKDFPHSLDRKNDNEKPDIVLPKFWV